MKNKLLTLLAVCGLSLPAFSQTSDSVQYKNQLGIITSPSLQYLFQNKELPVGLIYKHQVKPDQAWRFNVNGWLRKQKYPFIIFGDNSSFFMHQTNYSTNALLGYEWQRELNKRWSLYYGTETGVGYGQSKTNYDFSNYNIGQIASFSQQHNDNSTFSFILQPLAGIKFNITPRLYVTAETHIEISYSRSNQKNMETTFNPDQNPTTKELYDVAFTSLNVNYSPLSNIQLVYQF